MAGVFTAFFVFAINLSLLVLQSLKAARCVLIRKDLHEPT